MQSKEFRALMRDMERKGWTIKRTKKNHALLLSPDGETIIPMQYTQSDWRAMHNLKARLKRAGVEV